MSYENSDLRSPELYLNRELTWLAFNRRVLQEARDSTVPTLERLKFLAIVSSNLDEFFMKRIGGLKQQVGAGVDKLTADGRTPVQQINECSQVVRDLQVEQTEVTRMVFRELERSGIVVRRHSDLTEEEQLGLRLDYVRDVLPVVTPLGIDPAHPFPRISNLSLNLLIEVHKASGASSHVRVKVPVGRHTPRFVRVGRKHHYVPLEEVIAANLDLLLPNCTFGSCLPFRVTRNAATEPNQDSVGDLLEAIEAQLRNREFAPIVRLEVGRGAPTEQLDLLVRELGLEPETDLFQLDYLLGAADLMALAALDVPELREPPHRPVPNAEIAEDECLFASIRRRGSILLHHPTESFDGSVERFIDDASRDPKVVAIKATLYRTSESTRIVNGLVAAAREGKHVAVAIELKARFDEAANVRWAKRLEEAGVHVGYGIVGLKTHCKAILVVRREARGLTRYVHIGTGNYHAETARLYSDFGLLSCDEELGRDIADLFNALTTGSSVRRKYRKILTAPRVMKRELLDKIDREIVLHEKESGGRIRLKTNALEDKDVVEALYRAGRAGVRVDLLVRDTCRLRPGLEGLSKTITVISIVGRFLEHARIYHFRNGGEDEYFIGSADLMQRNLEHRVELLAPVSDRALRATLDGFLEGQIADRHRGWEMKPSGDYVQRRNQAASQELAASNLKVESSRGSLGEGLKRTRTSSSRILGLIARDSTA